MHLNNKDNSVLLTDIEINGSYLKIFEFNYELTKEAQQEIVIKHNFGNDVYDLLSTKGDLSIIPNALATLVQLVKLYKKYSSELYNARKST